MNTKNLRSKLSEYFFGSETSRKYKKTRSTYGEFCSNEISVGKFNKVSAESELKWRMYGKAFPVFCEILGTSLSIVLKDPHYLSIALFGECVRFTGRKDKNLESLMSQVNNVKDKYLRKSSLENLTVNDQALEEKEFNPENSGNYDGWLNQEDRYNN